jgi:hypothetical protein
MPSSAPTGAGFIAKERAIQADFVANFRDKHLAQIEWLSNRRRTLGFPRQSASCGTAARKTAATLRLASSMLVSPLAKEMFLWLSCSFDRYLA